MLPLALICGCEASSIHTGRKIGLSAFGATGPANGGILDSNMTGFGVKTAMRSTASD
jgi:hypothetical protein